MKKLLIAFLFTFSFGQLLIAQSNGRQETTTTYPEKGRYEVITSSIAVRDTFLLDRETGETWVLTESSKSNYVWQKLTRQANLKEILPEGFTGAAYQIVISGIAAKDIFLVNTITGATWTLYEDKKGTLIWGEITLPSGLFDY